MAGFPVEIHGCKFCCSTGWITHFGEKMANTSADDLVASLRAILQYANGIGSVNFYMAHGGSNWGFWAGLHHAIHPTAKLHSPPKHFGFNGQI